MDAPKITQIKITHLREAAWNPRQDYGAMPELEASIRERGILNPLQVRAAGDVYEVFCGHRRLRAAKAAELETLPCIIRPCEDREAQQLAIIDNLERENLGPMDEALAFGQLRDLGVPEPEIAARCVPERPGAQAYVHTRLALLELPKEGQELLQRGTLPLTVAAAILRCGPDQRKGALDLVSQRLADEEGEQRFRSTAADLIADIEQTFMLSLKGAQFDPEDDTLVPRGACGPCTFRTGNQGALFGEFQGEDRCTDSKCFKLKLSKTFDRRAKEAKKRGLEVVPAKDAKKFFTYGDHLNYDYVEVDSKVGKLLEAAGPKAPKPMLVQSPTAGHIHQVVKRDVAERLEAKVATSSGDDTKLSKAQREEQLRNKKLKRDDLVRDETERLLGERVTAAAEKAWADVKLPKKAAELLAKIVSGVCGLAYDGQAAVARRRKIPKLELGLESYIGTLNPTAQAGLAIELLVVEEHQMGSTDPRWTEFLKACGAESKALAKEVEANLRAADTKAAEAKAAAPRGKSAKKGKRK